MAIRFRRHVTKILAALLIVILGLITQLPSPAASSPDELRQRFAFERHELTSVPVAGYQQRRPVAPALEKISTWISAVGAAVALSDVDGNGRSDDQCLTDPRTDTVTVAPARTDGRYPPFVLDVAPLPYNRTTMAPMGCLPGDFNEDGRIDLLAYYWGRTPVLFLRLPEGLPGPTAYRPTELMPTVERWYTDTMVSTDLDGDGHLDLIVGNYFPDGARLLDPNAHDDPDMRMQDSMSRAYNGGRNRVLRWSSARGGTAPEVRFTEAHGVLSEDAARGWTLAIGAHDFTGDLLPEVYFANDFGPDRLFLNRSTPGRIELTEVTGSSGFTVPKSKQLGYDSFKGMGIDFADITGDGHTDMFVSNITSRYGLMESHFAWVNTGRLGDFAEGNAPFEDQSEQLGLARSGWGWDAKFADFDNDGTPELVQATGFTKGHANLWPQVAELAMANDELVRHIGAWMRHTPGWELAGRGHDAFFVRSANSRWANVAPLVGLGDNAISRGVAVSDVDGDGRVDFALARQWEPSYLYMNRSDRAETSLTLRLQLPTSDTPGPTLTVRPGADGDALTGSPAVGATATVRLPDGRRLTAQVDGGNGHASVRSPELYFGLGDLPANQRLDVRIDWRDRQGRIHHQDTTVTPGRWTVQLGGAS